MARSSLRIPDYYGFLGLDADVVIPMPTAAKTREIYKAYRSWTFTFSFAKGDMSSEARKARVSRNRLADAYRVLRNPERREGYERQLLEEKVRQARDAPRMLQCSGVDWSPVVEVSTDPKLRRVHEDSEDTVSQCGHVDWSRVAEVPNNSSRKPRRECERDSVVDTAILTSPASRRACSDMLGEAKTPGKCEQDVSRIQKAVDAEVVHANLLQQPPAVSNNTVSKRKKTKRSSSSRRARKKRLPVRCDRSFYPTYEQCLEDSPALADRKAWARKVFRVHKSRRRFFQKPTTTTTTATANGHDDDDSTNNKAVALLPFEPEDPRLFGLLLGALADDAAATADAVAAHAAEFDATARVFCQATGRVDAAPQIHAARERTRALQARLEERCALPLRRIGVELLGRHDDADTAAAASPTGPRRADPHAEDGGEEEEEREKEIYAVQSGAEWQQALLARLFPVSDELDQAHDKMTRMSMLARGLSRAESAMRGELAHDRYEAMQPALEHKSRDQKSWALRQYLLLVEDWP